MALLKYQNSTQTPKQKSKPLWKATPYILTLAIGFYGGNKFEQVSGIKGMLANFGNHLASKYGKTEQTIPIDSTNTVSIDTTINKIANQMPKGETVTNDTTKTAETNKSNIKPEQKSYYEQKLRNAKVITIKERVLNMGRDYDVFAGDEKVATVSGKDIRLAPGVVGDVFKLKTKDGKLLAYEQEHKKFLKLNRVASCYDSEGNLMGYFGEEKIRDLFSFSYVFHFYDAEKNEIGKSKKLGKSALNCRKARTTFSCTISWWHV